MKLRKIMVATALLMLSSASFADNGGAMSQGGTYVGLAGGWGSVIADNQATYWFSRDYNVLGSSDEGGFAGRVYTGYLFSLNAGSNWLFGPEIGYSYYNNTTYTIQPNEYSDDNLTFTQTGYGVDFLLNATYQFTNAINFSLKPGIQYAIQKISNPVDTREHTVAGWSKNTGILPEMNVEANWQVSQKAPLFVGAAYQYVMGHSQNVFGSFNNGAQPTVAARQMFTVNLEYMFH